MFHVKQIGAIPSQSVSCETICDTIVLKPLNFSSNGLVSVEIGLV
jgi:hypothetical protein